MSLLLDSRAAIAVMGWLLLLALVVWSLRHEDVVVRRRCRRAMARLRTQQPMPRARAGRRYGSAR